MFPAGTLQCSIGAGNDMQTHLLGIEIGGTKLQLVAGDETGAILEWQRFTVDPAKGAAGIRAQMESALGTLLAQWRPRLSPDRR